MTLTTRGKRLVLALYCLLIIFIVYKIITIENNCVGEDLSKYIAQDYYYGTPEEKERAIQKIYKWRGGIKLNDDNTHEIIFDCVQKK